MNATTDAMGQGEIKIALAGATGRLAPTMLKHFLSSSDPVIHVTMLVRDLEDSIARANGIVRSISVELAANLDDSVTIVPLSENDYTSPAKLEAVLDGQEVLVDLLRRWLPDQSIALIDAAIAVNVKHIVPTCWGVPLHDDYIRSIPPMLDSVKMEDHLRAAVAAQSSPPAGIRQTTYTLIHTGMFLELGMTAYRVVNLKPGENEKTLIFDGGEKEITSTCYDDIGKATSNVVRLALAGDARVLNKEVFIRTWKATQNELLSYAKELAPDRKWEVNNVDTRILEEYSKKKVEEGDRSADAVRGFLVRATIGLDYGRFARDDNDMLGIRLLEGEEIKAVVANYLKEITTETIMRDQAQVMPGH